MNVVKLYLFIVYNLDLFIDIVSSLAGYAELRSVCRETAKSRSVVDFGATYV